MFEWLTEIFPQGYANAVLGVGAALLLLFLVLLVIRTLRSPGTFVAGGRNRRTRLAIMDAAPVDSRRRLVLVRRDDVEHLILIGGPTDLVVERDIRLMPRQPRPAEPPAAPEPPAHRAAQPRPAEPPTPVKPPPAAPVARPDPSHHVTLPRPSMPMSAPPVIPGRAPSPAPAPKPHTPIDRAVEPPWKRNAASPVEPAGSPGDLDQALAHELQASLNEGSASKPAPAAVDDEMNRILGELSGNRR